MFVVHGEPIPQGSAKAYVQGGRAVITSDNMRLRPWRTRVAEEARKALTEPHSAFDGTSGPISVVVNFRIPRGKSVKREHPTTRPDLDKLVRAVFDALTEAGVVGDDSQITTLAAIKVYADIAQPGVTITVTSLEQR